MKPRPGSARIAPWLHDTNGLRVVVVGAGGFIGSHVTAAALVSGAQVSALAVGPIGRLRDAAHPSLRTTTVDPAAWPEAAAAAASAADAVIVLAWRPAPDGSHGDAPHERSANRKPTERLAEAVGRAGARLVFASSAAVYGSGGDAPLLEDYPAAPSSAYGVVKLETERALSRALGPAATSLRIGTVYGPGAPGARAIPSFARALACGARPTLRSGGLDVLDYVHVSDVAAAFVSAASGAIPGGVVNVGSGIGRATREVLADVARELGVDPDFTDTEVDRKPVRVVLDIGVAMERLGLRPAPWPETLREDVEWAVGKVRA